MAIVAVGVEQERAHGRLPPVQRQLRSTSEHQRRSCPYQRLHRGSDSARALHGRLLFLPGGQLGSLMSRSFGCSAREVRTVLGVFACTPAELGIYLEFLCELLRIV